MEEYICCWKITGELKVQDQMKWVQLINLAKSESEDNIVRENILYYE